LVRFGALFAAVYWLIAGDTAGGICIGVSEVWGLVDLLLYYD
jgi:hypothetical protein